MDFTPLESINMKKMKKILSFIPFSLWGWLCLNFTSFSRNNEVLRASFKFTEDFLTKLFHSDILTSIILLFFIPVLSLFCNLIFARKEKNRYLRSLYIVMSFLSFLSIPVFGLFLLIGFGSYL